MSNRPNRLTMARLAARYRRRPAALESLACHDDPQVRAIIASRLDAPADLLDRLAEDKEEVVRLCAAYNTATAPETLAGMLQDPSVPVRMFAAGNPALPSDRLKALLAAPQDTWLRVQAAANPRCTPEMLAEFRPIVEPAPWSQEPSVG